MSRMLKSMRNIPHRCCHSRAKYAHRYAPSKLVLLYRSLELKWRGWLRECTIQSWPSGRLADYMDSLHRPQIITYYTDLWPKQTLLKQSPLGTIFSGPDKVILFFFPVLIVTNTERHLSTSPGSTSRHKWNIAFFFAWSSLPIWKDLHFWVARQSKLL